MESQEENICQTQVPRGATIYHYFTPETPGRERKALETPKRDSMLNRSVKEDACYRTPDNILPRSPMKKPPTLIRKRRRRELSPINEDLDGDEEEAISQRLKKVKVSVEESFEKEPLPCYFSGDDFDMQTWNEKALNVGPTRDSGFGPWKEARLGRGDFASVYRVVDQLTGSVEGFAMKESRNMDEWRKTLFLKEAQALTMVEGHPHIVRYQGSWLKRYSEIADEEQAILTEPCDSDIQVATWGEDGFCETRLKRIVKHIASALSYVHSLGMVHLDVKPGNILISKCKLTGLETFKLADFGMATRIDGKGATRRGTTRYMDTYHVGWSAEADKGDVFSLGATICDVSSGQQLSYELTQECVDKTWLAEIPDVSEGFGELLEDMLAMKREDRPSAREVFERVTKLED
ncbi:hypothetical protein BSKO_01598 [Bryopsis sp. KO-2023]|nr:hypothetical protein BSKO_01598 [Bryopsis sp. KO-2023]